MFIILYPGGHVCSADSSEHKRFKRKMRKEKSGSFLQENIVACCLIEEGEYF